MRSTSPARQKTEPVKADVTLLEASWQRIRQHLKEEKRRIVQEIRQYPPPIPACDVQFNGLLEERTTILREIGQVNRALESDLTAADHLHLLEDFLLSSQHLKSALKEQIRQSLSLHTGRSSLSR